LGTAGFRAFVPESVALRNEGLATPQDANSKRMLVLAQLFGMCAAFAIALGAIIVNDDHAVVERGAYRYARHPSYTGAVIVFLGIGSALANWISLATSLVLVFIAFLYRVNVEERALAAAIAPSKQP
jgi:protein-S-isoprenylcysteine O-methyltransferase Ste14